MLLRNVFRRSSTVNSAREGLVQQIEAIIAAQKPLKPSKVAGVHEKGWRWTESKDSTRIVVERWTGATRVNLLFYARPGTLASARAAKQPKPSVPFLLLVEPGRARSLLGEGRLGGLSFALNALYLVDKADGDRFLDDPARLLRESVARGPNLVHLRPALETRILAYLEALGVEEELSAFAEAKSYRHEQVLYRRWLHDLRLFAM